jgi:hypothetical protein
LEKNYYGPVESCDPGKCMKSEAVECFILIQAFLPAQLFYKGAHSSHRL